MNRQITDRDMGVGDLWTLGNNFSYLFSDETKPIRFKANTDDTKTLETIFSIVFGIEKRLRIGIVVENKEFGTRDMIVKISDTKKGCFFKSGVVLLEIEHDRHFIEKNDFDDEMFEKTINNLIENFVINKNVVEVVDSINGTVEIYKNVSFDFHRVIDDTVVVGGDFFVKINDFDNTNFEFVDDPFLIYVKKNGLNAKVDDLKKEFR